MKRWFATLFVLTVSTAVLRADVTIVQKTTIEGGMAAVAGDSMPTPTMTVRVKGMRSRTEVDAGAVSVITIADLIAKQIIVLRPDQKTATIASAPASPAAGAAAPQVPAAIAAGVDAEIKPTGKTQVIDGIKCDEYAFTTTMDMSAMTGAAMPPEAAAAMQGVRMVMGGSMWVAKDLPGAADYVAFQKASATTDMTGAVTGASGVNLPGMDKVIKAMGSLDGMAYLTEMTMKIEGSGQIADMMKQMGPMKITVRTISVKADPLSDDLFKVPEGYTVVK